MKVFIIGITGGVGSLLARTLQTRGDMVAGLVRRDEQREALERVGVGAAVGDLASLTSPQLAGLIGDVDAIVFAAGTDGSTPDRATAVDGGGAVKAIDAAQLNGIARFLLVSVFPEAWRERNVGADFDHYIAVKKDAEIALSQSGLDWVILRPSLLVDDAGRGTIAMGPAQIHEDVTRQDVADTLAALLAEPRIGQQILELNRGDMPIAEAVEVNIAAR